MWIMIASTIFIILYCNISVKYTKKSTKPINKDMFIHIINVMGGELWDDKSLYAPMCACCSKTWCIVFTCYCTIIVRILQYLVYNKYEVGPPANKYHKYQLQITMLCSVYYYHRIAGEYDGPPLEKIYVIF